MADTKISALTAASAALGTQEIPVNEGGVSKKLTVAQIASYGATSMPAGPATNQRVFRTDLGLEFYWDGTRWLSTTLYELALGAGENLAIMANLVRAISTDLALYLVDAFVTWYVATTNNGTHYWTFQFYSTAGSNTDSNRGSAISTAAGSPNVYTSSTIVIGVALTTASIKVGVQNLNATGAGNLYWYPMIRYRKIAT